MSDTADICRGGPDDRGTNAAVYVAPTSRTHWAIRLADADDNVTDRVRPKPAGYNQADHTAREAERIRAEAKVAAWGAPPLPPCAYVLTDDPVPPPIERHARLSLHIMGSLGWHHSHVRSLLHQSGYDEGALNCMHNYYREQYPRAGMAH